MNVSLNQYIFLYINGKIDTRYKILDYVLIIVLDYRWIFFYFGILVGFRINKNFLVGFGLCSGLILSRIFGLESATNKLS